MPESDFLLSCSCSPSHTNVNENRGWKKIYQVFVCMVFAIPDYHILIFLLPSLSLSFFLSPSLFFCLSDLFMTFYPGSARTNVKYTLSGSPLLLSNPHRSFFFFFFESDDPRNLGFYEKHYFLDIISTRSVEEFDLLDNSFETLFFKNIPVASQDSPSHTSSDGNNNPDGRVKFPIKKKTDNSNEQKAPELSMEYWVSAQFFQIITLGW